MCFVMTKIILVAVPTNDRKGDPGIAISLGPSPHLVSLFESLSGRYLLSHSTFCTVQYSNTLILKKDIQTCGASSCWSVMWKHWDAIFTAKVTVKMSN